MKKIAILFLLFSFPNGIPQTLSKKEIAILNLLEIKTENLNLKNTKIQKDLNEINPVLNFLITHNSNL